MLAEVLATSSKSLLKILEQLLEKLSEDYNNKVFAPILEADIVGYLYHLWIEHFKSAKNIHLDTRICISTNEKFDLVIGSLDYHSKRPCISKPEFIIEFKTFPIGFSDPQHRVHYHHVIDDDIPKLTKIKQPLKGRFILLFDEDDYLKGLDRTNNTSRLNRIKRVRNEHDPLIQIINMKKIEKKLQREII